MEVFLRRLRHPKRRVQYSPSRSPVYGFVRQKDFRYLKVRFLVCFVAGVTIIVIHPLTKMVVGEHEQTFWPLRFTVPSLVVEDISGQNSQEFLFFYSFLIWLLGTICLSLMVCHTECFPEKPSLCRNEQVCQWGAKSLKRFERSNGLDTALKTYLLHTFTHNIGPILLSC